MFKKVVLTILASLCFVYVSVAQQIGDTKFLWTHNFQFFQYEYKIGATLQETGSHCDIWVENPNITAITIDYANSYIYVGTFNTGIFRRNLNSTEWEKFSAGIPASLRVPGTTSTIHDMIMTDDNTVLAAADEGLYYLVTGTDRWRRADITTPVFSLCKTENGIFAGLGGYTFKQTGDDDDEDGDVDIDMGAFFSSDNGRTWQEKNYGFPVDNDNEHLAIRDIAYSNGVLYASTDAGMFISNNNGNHWEGIEREISLSKANVKVKITDSSLDEDQMANLGKSFGAGWEKMIAAEGISKEDSIVVVEYDSLGNFVRKWLCPAADILTTDTRYQVRNMEGIVGDEGKFTAKLNPYTISGGDGSLSNYSILDVNNFKYRGESGYATVVDPQNQLLLLVSYPENPSYEVGGRFITVTYVNDGDTLVWVEQSSTLRGINKDKKGIIISNDNLVKGNPVDNYDLLNEADIIAQMKATTASGLFFTSMAGRGQILYGGNENGVYKTENGGKDWVLYGSSVEGLENTDVQSLLVNESGVLYAGTIDGVFSNPADGAIWTPATEIDDEANINCLFFGNNALYAGTQLGLFSTSDNGLTWQTDNRHLTSFIENDEIVQILDAIENSTPDFPDQGIYSVITSNLGAENIPDSDNNSKVNIVIHDIQDKGQNYNNTSNGKNGITAVAGYIRPEDKSPIGKSNKGEYVYIDSHEVTTDEKAGAVAHQLIRMIVVNKDYNEERWVVEGLSYIGDRLCGYPLPTAMPDFQSLTGANKVFSLISGTALSPWEVDPEKGQIVNRLTMVSMFFNYLYENFGGLDLFKNIINEQENGWIGVQNAMTDGVKFSDIYAAWAITNCINDVNQTDPTTGAKLGYENQVYSNVLNRYMEEKIIGMNSGAIFGHNSSMSAYKEYKVNWEYKDGLNNWAYFIRYFFPDPAINDPAQSVINYWDKDKVTGEPITYRLNAADDAQIRVQLIKVKGDGSKDVEDLTPTFNEEKELEFNVLSKYEPNSDKTELKYHHMFIIMSNQDSLGKAAKLIQVKDVAAPEVNYNIVHNPMYPEFIDFYVSTNERIFKDVNVFEKPTTDVIFFTDTTTIDMELFDVAKDANNQPVTYIYNGRYHIEQSANLTMRIRKLQDLGGNDASMISFPLTIEEVTSASKKSLASADKNIFVEIPQGAVTKKVPVTLSAVSAQFDAAEEKIDPDLFVGKTYQIGPQALNLEKNAILTFKYDDTDLNEIEEEDLGLYQKEGKEWIRVKAFQDTKENCFKASISQLGVFSIMKNSVGADTELDNLLPTTFALSQNYPNPFNPTTEIQYQVPEKNHVSIKVFNISGQLVKTLVNTAKDAGSFTVKWDGRDQAGFQLPSGVYMYEMKAGSFIQNKKMLLIK